MSLVELSKKIVGWYAESHRKLPWRDTNDAYRIWLSEIILQQTRVEQGLPYYLRFIEKFPSVFDLAAANETMVLRLWQGLGYYSRARHMLHCARIVVAQFGGSFPSDAAALAKLPGIGNYTAAAIASMAFSLPEAVVDGNVFRVLSRVFALATPINTTTGRKQFNELAVQLLDREQPGVHNQAMMELGALICTPKSPLCESCPVQSQCLARHQNIQDVLPQKIKKKSSRDRYFYYFVLTDGHRILMKRREAGDIWQGLFDFPMIERERPARIKTVINKFEKTFGSRLRAPLVFPGYRHVLTHQNIQSQFLVFSGTERYPELCNDANRYYTRKMIDRLPKPALISRFLNDSALF